MKNKLIYICIMSLLLFVVGCSNNPNKESTIKKTLRITKAKLKKKKRTCEKDITISFAGDVTMGNYKGSSYYGSFDHEFKRQGEDYNYFLKNVKPVFKKTT